MHFKTSLYLFAGNTVSLCKINATISNLSLQEDIWSVLLQLFLPSFC